MADSDGTASEVAGVERLALRRRHVDGCKPLQCKSIPKIIEHQAFELLDRGDACVAQGERWLLDQLLGQLPGAWKDFVFRDYFVDNTEPQRLLRRKFLSG